MKILNYSFLAALFLFGCTQNNKAKVVPPERHKAQVEVYVDSLLNSYPGVLNNDITKESFSKIIRIHVESFKGKSAPFINDIPFIFERMLAYGNDGFSSNSGKYLVKFSFAAKHYDAANKHESTIQIFSVVDGERAAKLVDGESYYLRGVLKDFANCKGSIVLPSGRCFEGYPRVSSASGVLSSDNDLPYVNLGSFILDSLDFKLFPK